MHAGGGNEGRREGGTVESSPRGAEYERGRGSAPPHKHRLKREKEREIGHVRNMKAQKRSVLSPSFLSFTSWSGGNTRGGHPPLVTPRIFPAARNDRAEATAACRGIPSTVVPQRLTLIVSPTSYSTYRPRKTPAKQIPLVRRPGRDG